jgi:NAD(P)H-hydrate epimerase
MSGAPALAGLGALRVGADVVYIAAPERAADIAATYSPSFITLPLHGDFLTEEHLTEIFDFAKTHHVTGLIIGNGLGREKRTQKAIVKIIDGFEVPIVADADALYALGEVSHLRMLLKDKNIILTPHAEEFAELTGDKTPKDLDERVSIIKDNAKKISATILLKGRIDIISDGDKVSLNKTGNVYMTKGGFGDLLAGVCGGLLSRRVNKLDTYTAACAGAYINGRAGDLVGEKTLESMMVTDAIEVIPDIIRRG